VPREKGKEEGAEVSLLKTGPLPVKQRRPHWILTLVRVGLKEIDVSYTLYEALKSAWIKANPQATPQQYQQAMRRLARKAGV
jgi:hypothetical protein